MTNQTPDYETAKRSLRRKLFPGIVILVILAICIILMLERKNAPVRPGTPQAAPATAPAK